MLQDNTHITNRNDVIKMGSYILPVVPACCNSLHIIQAVTEVISLGLATTVLPAARAGAIFQVSRYRGKFQGLIRPAVVKDEPA